MHAPLSPTLRVEWRAFDTLGPLADEWRALSARALEPNVFYEPAFALAAAPVFGQGAGAVLVWRKTRLVGLFPMLIERRRYGLAGAVAGWTYRFAPLGVPLVDPEEPAATIAAWLDHLAAQPAMPALLLLPLVPAQGAFAAALEAALTRGGRRSATFDSHQRAVLAPGAERTNYLVRAMSASRLKKLRRQRRRLEEFAPVTFTTVTAPQDIAPALQDFLVIEASGWKGLAGTAAIADPAIRHFVESAVAALAAEGKARIDRICLNGRAIAVYVTLLSGNVAWCWKTAYTEGLARSSPGVQLALDLTEALLKESAVERVDSCATADHPMIDHIWRERLALCDRLIALRPAALPFGLACRLETFRRGLIAAAKAVRARLRS
jgi:CelD/BcsL family acetyltransferase involved in cellulose biosynthesis